MRRGDALGKACMTEPSAYQQFVIPVRSKRVMQLDVQVQITFERCGLRVNDSDRKGTIKTNEDRPGAAGNIGLLG